jgi:hypothetical protein
MKSVYISGVTLASVALKAAGNLAKGKDAEEKRRRGRRCFIDRISVCHCWYYKRK